MSEVYYNEHDSQAADWLENLIADGLIPRGTVDRRSIAIVQPGDLTGFIHCHFFAGIGGWALAAELAGWPADLALWTGSCPCQPFSLAGEKLGADDERHLWPHLLRLIDACRPPIVVGEQVAGALGYGWLDGVRADLGRANYASRACDIPAAAMDSPQIRQRLWWIGLLQDHVASRHGGGLRALGRDDSQGAGAAAGERGPDDDAALPGGRDAPGAGAARALGDPHGRAEGGQPGGEPGTEAGAQREGRQPDGGLAHPAAVADGGEQRSASGDGPMVDSEGQRWGEGRPEPELRSGRDTTASPDAPSRGSLALASSAGELGGEHQPQRGPEGRVAAAGDDARELGLRGDGEGLGGGAGLREDRPLGHGAEPADADGPGERAQALGRAARWRLAVGEQPARLGGDAAGWSDAARADVPNGSWWADHRWIVCHDGKARRVPDPPVPLLVTGLSGRVAVLRSGEVLEAPPPDADVRWVSRVPAWKGFGNAICPVLGAEVLKALLDG